MTELGKMRIVLQTSCWVHLVEPRVDGQAEDVGALGHFDVLLVVGVPTASIHIR